MLGAFHSFLIIWTLLVSHLLWQLGAIIGCERPGVEILQPDEAGDEGVGVRAADGDPVQLARQHVACAVKTTWIVQLFWG